MINHQHSAGESCHPECWQAAAESRASASDLVPCPHCLALMGYEEVICGPCTDWWRKVPAENRYPNWPVNWQREREERLKARNP